MKTVKEGDIVYIKKNKNPIKITSIGKKCIEGEVLNKWLKAKARYIYFFDRDIMEKQIA